MWNEIYREWFNLLYKEIKMSVNELRILGKKLLDKKAYVNRLQIKIKLVILRIPDL